MKKTITNAALIIALVSGIFAAILTTNLGFFLAGLITATGAAAGLLENNGEHFSDVVNKFNS